MNGADCGMMGGACCWFITITGCHFFFWCSHVYENCNYSAVLRSNSAIDRVICASIESCGFELYFDSAKLAGGEKKGLTTMIYSIFTRTLGVSRVEHEKHEYFSIQFIFVFNGNSFDFVYSVD